MNTTSKFTSAYRTSMMVADLGHPVIAYLESAVARPVPGVEDRWYMRVKGDKMVVTYCLTDNTINLHECSYGAFKALVEAGNLETNQVVEVPEFDKYIGNVLLRKLRVHHLH